MIANARTAVMTTDDEYYCDIERTPLSLVKLHYLNVTTANMNMYMLDKIVVQRVAQHLYSFHVEIL